jgi:hypothetical protein
MTESLRLAPGLRRQLDDAHISIARRPEGLRQVEVEPLPPRLWEQLRQQLQEEYRRATGEAHAVLLVEGAAAGQPND